MLKIKNILTFNYLSTKDVEGATPQFWTWLFGFPCPEKLDSCADYVENIATFDGDYIRQQISVRELLWQSENGLFEEEREENRISTENLAIFAELLILIKQQKIDFITRAF